MSVGVVELSTCSGLGNKLLDLLTGLRQSSSPFSSCMTPSMALRDYGQNVNARVGAVTEWWEDPDVHCANKGQHPLNSLRMVNGQLLGSFIQKQAGHLFGRD